MRLSRLLVIVAVLLVVMVPLSVGAQAPVAFVPMISNGYVPLMPTQLLSNGTLDGAGSPWATVGDATIEHGMASLCAPLPGVAGIAQQVSTAGRTRATLIVRFRATGPGLDVAVYDWTLTPIFSILPDDVLLDGQWHTLATAVLLPTADAYLVAALCTTQSRGVASIQVDSASLIIMQPYPSLPLPRP